ncbi:histidine phosphatase family protein [Dongshaea marina]|uniref:histidine phosphatase family protein n=1 Tax=Dongshaea marina TaxID=2047966 RepID=UPI000D3E47A3|nr:histidine phosphatase family protein [Dongshaea marina]
MTQNKKLMVGVLFLLTLSCSVRAEPSSKLLWAGVLFRHGDRTPTAALPKHPYPWHQGLGQLTARGMHQEYLLGQSLRERYVQRYSLVEPQFSVSELYVRSTDKDRTLMSASSLLYGLYPPGSGPKLDTGQDALPGGFQPIPIHTVLRSRDPLLRPQELHHKEIYKLQQHYVYASPTWQRTEQSLGKYFANWSRVSGFEIDSLQSAKKFASNLYIRSLHQIPLPAGLSPIELKALIPLAGWIHAEQFKPYPVGVVVGGPWLREVSMQMQAYLKGSSSVRLRLYSAHDTNILGVMSALREPLSTNPPYASRIQAELFRRQGHDRVEFRYNGQPIALPCSLNGRSCSLERFIQYVAGLKPG